MLPPIARSEHRAFSQRGDESGGWNPTIQECTLANDETKKTKKNKDSFKGRRSKLDPYADKVGTLPDREVAELAGVTVENVRTWRKRRGIPSPGRSAAAEKPTRARKGKKKSRRRKSKLDPFQAELGQTPDTEIAKKAGTTVENVRAYRKRHGIEAEWQKSSSDAPVVEAPAPAAAPAAAAPSRPVSRPSRRKAAGAARAWAYRVTADIGGESKEFVTFGTDMAEAAREAVDKLGADAQVRKIEEVGVAL